MGPSWLRGVAPSGRIRSASPVILAKIARFGYGSADRGAESPNRSRPLAQTSDMLAPAPTKISRLAATLQVSPRTTYEVAWKTELV